MAGNNEYGFVHFSGMTSTFSIQYKMCRLKLPKWTKYLFYSDIKAFSGLSKSVEEDFFTESQLLISGSPDQKTKCRTCFHVTVKEIEIESAKRGKPPCQL